MKLSKKTIEMLEYLERNINPDVEDDFIKQWEDFTFDRFYGDIFVPCRKVVAKPFDDLPSININDAIEDYDCMLQHQLAGVCKNLASKPNCLNVRANYGTGILSSVFGADLFVMPRSTNTLPTTKPIGGLDEMEELLDKGMPALNNGLGQKVFDFGALCLEAFEKYPKVKKYVNVYHPDLQGPLDICELLMGGEMFYSFYDDPDVVCSLLTLITDTYTTFLNKWHDLFPPRKGMNTHWNLWHKGEILIRNDSAMNLSPDMYKQFSVPYDSALLKRFNGGVIHFCGKGDHYIEELSKMEGVYGINMSQPEYNDMETIYRNTVDKGIKILSFNPSQAEKDKAREGSFRGNMHVE